jgi:hypothetical protein
MVILMDMDTAIPTVGIQRLSSALDFMGDTAADLAGSVGKPIFR